MYTTAVITYIRDVFCHARFKCTCETADYGSDKEKKIYIKEQRIKIIWDETIAIIRLFQAEFVKCANDTVTDGTFARWLNVMNSEHIIIEIMGTVC